MLMGLILRYRRPLVVALHLNLIFLSNYIAFWLRFEGRIDYRDLELFLKMLPVLVVVRGSIFIPFKLFEGLWRYTSIWDLEGIIVAVVSSSVVFFILTQWVFGLTGYPRSVIIIDAIVLIFLLGGIRLPARIYRELRSPAKGKRVLIYGAGDAAEMIVRDMKNNPFYDYEPVGFVDDNSRKVGQRIHGVRVLGTRKNLTAILESKKPDEVLVAIPTAEPSTLREILRLLEPYKVPIKTLPNLRDILNGKVTVSQIRSLAVEDLLPRAPVSLDSRPVQHLIASKRVLVTGAGGSIGSELCRQILPLKPSSLILYDRYENGLYDVANELSDRDPSLIMHSLIGDVTDKKRVQNVFSATRPEIVFHAAAHKHVPLMEKNPCEAIKNNVTGTRILANISHENSVEKFILISTDKAVNPSSVMGASKRVGELIVQEMSTQSPTCFVTVRFGNVIGSNGSVVPMFLNQIKKGGPVTVTHPEMRRFFMLIPEAVQLVLHAAALGEGGEIFVLEMGDQIKVLDMARNLIRLSGYVPEEEIPIVFIGLRPGEKIIEELIAADEHAEPSRAEKILRVCSKITTKKSVLSTVHDLESLATEGNSAAVVETLRLLVPTFRSFEASTPLPSPDYPDIYV